MTERECSSTMYNSFCNPQRPEDTAVAAVDRMIPRVGLSEDENSSIDGLFQMSIIARTLLFLITRTIARTKITIRKKKTVMTVIQDLQVFERIGQWHGCIWRDVWGVPNHSHVDHYLQDFRLSLPSVLSLYNQIWHYKKLKENCLEAIQVQNCSLEDNAPQPSERYFTQKTAEGLSRCGSCDYGEEGKEEPTPHNLMISTATAVVKQLPTTKPTDMFKREMQLDVIMGINVRN